MSIGNGWSEGVNVGWDRKECFLHRTWRRSCTTSSPPPPPPPPPVAQSAPAPPRRVSHIVVKAAHPNAETNNGSEEVKTAESSGVDANAAIVSEIEYVFGSGVQN